MTALQLRLQRPCEPSRKVCFSQSRAATSPCPSIFARPLPFNERELDAAYPSRGQGQLRRVLAVHSPRGAPRSALLSCVACAHKADAAVSRARLPARSHARTRGSARHRGPRLRSRTPSPHEFRHSAYIQVPFVGHVAALKDHSGCRGKHRRWIPRSRTYPHRMSLTYLPRLRRSTHFQQRSRKRHPLSRSVISALPASPPTTCAPSRIPATPSPTCSGDGHASSTPREVDFGAEASRPSHLSYAATSASISSAIRWTTDTTVTGDLITSPNDQSLTGVVDVSTPTNRTRLDIQSPNIFGASTKETVSGTLDGHPIDLEMNAKLGL